MHTPEHASWKSIKPRFYTDARAHYRDSVLPDLVERPNVVPLHDIDPKRPFYALELALKHEMYRTYYETAEQAPSCPYHEELIIGYVHERYFILVRC